MKPLNPFLITPGKVSAEANSAPRNMWVTSHILNLQQPLKSGEKKQVTPKNNK